MTNLMINYAEEVGGVQACANDNFVAFKLTFY